MFRFLSKYLFFLVFCLNLNAQQPNPEMQRQMDSVRLLISGNAPDTSKAAALVGLSETIYYYKPDTVIPLCQMALEIVEKNLAENPGEQARIAFLTVKSLALGNIGFIYDNYGDIEKSIDYSIQSLKIDEELGNKSGMAGSLNNIGFMYKNQKEYELAMEYYKRGLAIYTELGNKKGIGYVFNNLGLLYKEMGQVDSARNYYNRSLVYRLEVGDKRGSASVYNNLGSTVLHEGKIKEALDY